MEVGRGQHEQAAVVSVAVAHRNPPAHVEVRFPQDSLHPFVQAVHEGLVVVVLDSLPQLFDDVVVRWRKGME